MALQHLARQYDVSAKEVNETILRVILKKLGKTEKCQCRTSDIVVKPRVKWARPHCRMCWRWQQSIGGNRTATYLGSFKPLTSDFERDLDAILRITHSLEDQKENRQKNNSLQGDLR